jgi:GT2 family glycosyltransferase
MLAIITVVYRNYEVVKDFISSLSVQSSQAYMLYIVDVTDEKERQLIPWIRKIEDRVTYVTAQNKGYSHGVNTGIALALKHGSTHYAVVNPDIVFDTNFVLHATHSLADHPRTIIGGKIYYAPGFEFHTKTPTIDTIPYPLVPDRYYLWYAGATVDWNHATVTHRGVDSKDNEDFDISSATDLVSGCCMIYDKTVHDIVGAWDTNYFMYYEDADYCERAKQRGIKIFYDPTIVLWHKNAQSTGGSGSPFHGREMAKSRLRFGLKYAPLKTKLHLIKNYVFSKT